MNDSVDVVVVCRWAAVLTDIEKKVSFVSVEKHVKKKYLPCEVQAFLKILVFLLLCKITVIT